MENVVAISNCYEKVEIGYVSTFVRMNRITNKVLSVTYYWDEKINSNHSKVFDSFVSLNAFIYELLAAKNEAELNSLESQPYEG